MAERSREAPASDGADSPVVVRRRPWWRFASFAAIGVLLLLALAIAVLWIERRPIATHYLKREFEQRGVQASYRLDRVGLRTQQVSDLVIGDPKHPDLVARRAIVQMRIKWNGSARTVRKARVCRPQPHPTSSHAPISRASSSLAMAATVTP